MQIIRLRFLILSMGLVPISSVASPSFDCSAVKGSSIEKLVCEDNELTALDLKLLDIYDQAVKKVDDKNLSSLKAIQRGWIKGRNDCWKSEDLKKCVADSYTYRIAEIQAEYELVNPNGPFMYLCPKSQPNRLEIFYYPTNPATAKAKYGDETSLMYAQSTGSEIHYQGRNERLSRREGEILVSWGYGVKEMVCKDISSSSD